MSLTLKTFEPFGLAILVGVILVVSVILCTKKRIKQRRDPIDGHVMNIGKQIAGINSQEQSIRPTTDYYKVPQYPPRPVTIDVEAGEYIDDAVIDDAVNDSFMDTFIDAFIGAFTHEAE